MKKHRVITTVALLALILPATANGGSLLSGYGGPGQGNQAILGATVIGGASGGSGGGSSGGGGSGSGTESSSGATSNPSLALKSSGNGVTRTSSKAKIPNGQASGSSAGAYQAPSTLSANEAASVGTPALGISGTDLVYIVLAFAALLLTAAITGRLVRRPR